MSNQNIREGDRVQFLSMPTEQGREVFDKEPVEGAGTVVDRFSETKHTGVDSKIEQDFVEIDLDDGERHKVNESYVGNTIEGGGPGVSVQPLPGNDGRGGGLRGPTRRTDIGRGPDGEFDRPETDPDIAPAPIARDDESGRFGLDPFDLSSGGVGDGLDLFDGDGL